jgi:hypothetical protein
MNSVKRLISLVNKVATDARGIARDETIGLVVIRDLCL